ncbi:hypothetical protein AAGW05_08850 [Arthrobacter sp. LAPM80]|uniref:hypothetical protein n=1 Tax=Arthrobacter sp. LAPM80 TaxID=3141788 RepID=UPI00398B4172
MVLSIGIFFSLMITRLARTLPATLSSGLTVHGVSAVDTAYLTGRGYNPSHRGGVFSTAQPDLISTTDHGCHAEQGPGAPG